MIHDNEELLRRYTLYRSDPWAFLRDCVYTLDQVDKNTPIKAFPSHREYLELYVRIWQRYNLIAVPKSRRMTMSWTNIALYLWDTMFNKGRFNAFVSRKEEAAGELVERAEFIYSHIPESVLPSKLLPKIRGGKMKIKPPVLEFEDMHSKIQGFPMGANQLRQYTFSGILGDESAFWPEAQKFYAGSKPTLDGGGRMTMLSSPSPGFFKKLIFDTLNKDHDIEVDPEAIGLEVKKPLQGVRIWTNPGNRFLIFEAHYTADPAKRDPEFKEMLKATLPRREYLQEYELNWDSFAGLPVYEDFKARLHLTQEPLTPKLGLPLLCGWDFGLTPSCIVGQLQENQLVILKEFVAKNKDIQVFGPEVMEQMKILYPAWQDQDKDFRHYIDPAGTFRKDTDSNTCMKQMHTDGFRNLTPGKVTWAERKGGVNHFLLKHTKQGPGIIMHEPSSPILVRGFRGGFMYPESNEEIEPNQLRPLKNEYSHPHDALQYLCGGVRDLQRSQNIIIPTPSYSFKKEGEPINQGDLRYGRKQFR